MIKLKGRFFLQTFQTKPDLSMGVEDMLRQKTQYPTKLPISRSFDYFRHCFRLLYYALVVPYNFELGDNGKIGISKTNPVIKYCVGFLHFYGLLLHLQWLIRTVHAVSSNTSLDPNAFCMLLANTILLVGTFNFLYLIWFKKETLLRFFELLIHIPRPNVNAGYTLPELAELFFSLGTVLLFSGLAIAANPWEMIALGFGFNLTLLENYPITFGVYKFLTYLIFCFVVITINVSSIISNLGCVAVYRMGLECIETLKNSPTLEEVTEYYEGMKEALCAMNDITGIQVLVCVLNVLIYFSKTLIEIFESGHAAQASVVIIYIIVCTIFFLLAAIGSKNLGKIDDYLFRNRNVADYRGNLCTVLLLKEDISFKPLGLKAYEFLINFGLIVSIFSTVLTYLVVLLQFPNSRLVNIFP